jgi:hypothetical protein
MMLAIAISVTVHLLWIKTYRPATEAQQPADLVSTD